ncbi:helix-turn-helix domain-containing protein [Candidatus Nomurabacteria bacterium]|nr:helix-turn-helix domain-containing protein [Candidatus Kaiserbacteria bacterium]MCB9815481.1 helix-turn-helix domain-containing protein [Candidatus Nomurabacteria bacterium]MCB9826649.1 helix-turn-helix domain-containing protein [Candidatus Nomurabacteria bacterium]
MVRNEEKYQQAISLRKRGFTLEEIAKYCDISKSTASLWLKNKAFSAQVKKQNVKRAGQENAKRLKLVNKARSGERLTRYKDAVKSAETEYKHYKNNPLFVAGLMLYLAQGDLKEARVIRLSTHHVESHKIFIKFATEYLGVEKARLRFWILLYSDLKEEKCMKKWKTYTGIPYSQFFKNQVIGNHSKKRTLHFGVGNTIIGNTVLKYKLNRWIELATKELTK